MRKYIILLTVLVMAAGLFAQAPEPTGFGNAGMFKDWIKTGTMTLTNKTLTSPTITGTGTFVFASGEINGNLTLAQDEYFFNSTDGEAGIGFNDDAVTLASFIVQSVNDSANLSDNDLLRIVFRAYDDSLGVTDWGEFITRLTDVSDESEDSEIDFGLFSAGTKVYPVAITASGIRLEGATADAYETTVAVEDPTADRTVTLPNYTGAIPLVVAQGSTQTSHSEASTTDITGSSLSIADSTLAAGYSIKWTLAGTCTGANGTKDVILYIDDAAIVTLQMAQTDVGDWTAEFVMHQNTAYNAQDAFGTLNQAEEPIQMDYATDTTDFGDDSATPVKCQVALAHADDTITVEYVLVEMWKQ